MTNLYPIMRILPETVIEPEVLGSKEKFWFLSAGDEHDWLFKYPQNNTGQHWAEKIAAEVAAILEIPHANVELAEFKDVHGSATQSFIKNDLRPDLVHGNELLAGMVTGYDRDRRFQQSDHTFENILKAMQATFAPSDLEGELSVFASYLILDAIIGNTDRHHENWAVLRWTSDTYLRTKLAPSFDHASSLGRELEDHGTSKSREGRLKGASIGRYAEKARGAIYWDSNEKRAPGPLELVRKANRSYPKMFQPTLSRLATFDQDNLVLYFGSYTIALDDRHGSYIRPCFCGTQPTATSSITIMDTRTLYLAWQDKSATRLWFPIGRLDVNMREQLYEFQYTRGALNAQGKTGFQPLLSFPDFQQRYQSSELFPLFRNRVISNKRPDFAEYLRHLDLSPANSDPVEILSVDGGYRATDSLEVFPRIEKSDDGGFLCRFFLHGWRHVNEVAKTRLEALHEGEILRASIEINNPATSIAVQIQTEDYVMLGWTPRYLVKDLIHSISHSPSSLVASVIRVNPAPAPSKQRVLIEFRGHWPDEYSPMSGEEFQPINGITER